MENKPAQDVKQLVQSEPSLRDDLYIRGFLLTDAPGLDDAGYPFYGAWCGAQLGRFRLRVHPVASWYAVERAGRHLFLVGHAYNPFDMEHEEGRILERIAAAADEGIGPALDVIDELSGLFVLGIIEGDRVLVVGDCSGMKYACYAAVGGHVYVASHMELVADVCRVTEDPYVRRLTRSRWYPYMMGAYLPGDLTAFEEVKRLSPNTYVEFVVAKPRYGAVGKGVRVIDLAPGVDPARLRHELLESGADMVEGYVEQHAALAGLYPGSVNTVRVNTLYREGEAEIIGAVLRFGISGNVDNLGAGGRAAPVAITDGTLEGPAVTSDATLEFVIDVHPVTGTRITGFQIPMWEEVKQLALDAASVVPEAGTVGWDIAVSKEGPLLIEGNLDWGLVLWQLPAQQGKRDLVEQLLSNA